MRRVLKYSLHLLLPSLLLFHPLLYFELLCSKVELLNVFDVLLVVVAVNVVDDLAEFALEDFLACFITLPLEVVEELLDRLFELLIAYVLSL